MLLTYLQYSPAYKMTKGSHPYALFVKHLVAHSVNSLFIFTLANGTAVFTNHSTVCNSNCPWLLRLTSKRS